MDRWKLYAAGGVLVVLLLAVGGWLSRGVLVRLFPIHHTGEVYRIGKFHKGGIASRGESTRQLNQFAIIFRDGFQCEGTDTSFAAVKEGDTVRIRGYHDVKGWPVLDPEWWECEEGQLVRLVAEGPVG